MILTRENYYSAEADAAYMSASQYKAFQECEAAALAELRGEWKRPETTALLVGSYVDAHFEGTLDVFRAQHPEIINRDNSLKADYAAANNVISRLEQDRLFTLLMSGKKQVIKTGTIAGVLFKVRMDSLLNEAQVEQIVSEFPETATALGYPFSAGAIVDLKIMRDMKPMWSEKLHQRIPFVEFYGYDLQGAIYNAVDGRELPFVLAVGTKEKEPDLAALAVPPEDLAAKLAEIEDNAPRYAAIKEGKQPARRCEQCEYCRRTRRLSTIVNYREAGHRG